MPDGGKALIDHAGSDHGRDRKRYRQPGGQRKHTIRPSKDGPADAEDARRDVGRDRQHALTRQPGRAPLRERAPGSRGPAEMGGGGEEAGGDEGKSKAKPGEPEGAVRRQPAYRCAKCEQRQQPIARAGRRGEENDGIGWVHTMCSRE